MTIKNPPVGKFVNWQRAYGGELASSAKLGQPLVAAFNHLRQFRAGEYIASYSGRVNPAINGNGASEFHIITRFPVQSGAGDVPLIITQKNWKRGYAAGNETIAWFKDYTDGAADVTLYDSPAEPITTTNDTANSKPHGKKSEWAVDVEPTAANDGFRCSRLDIDNALIHRLNVFGCPATPDLDADEAVVSSATVSSGDVLRGYVHGTDDGTIGALVHYLDAEDSVIHNTCRALLNTPYALGVHLNNEAAYIPIRSDGAVNSMTYMVKARNLTGAAGDIACDPAIVISGDAAARIRMSSTTAADNVVYTIPGGGLANPTLKTTADFGDTLNIDPAGDTITIEALSGAGNDVYIQAVSLWEPYRYR